MIFECGPQGADVKVCKHLARMVIPNIIIEHETLSNKPKLVRECGKTAENLLNDGCEKIIIVWDLYPAWRKEGEKPCRKEDRDMIFASLNKDKVDLSKVHLVCIEEELEAWLLADTRAINTVLSKPTHPVKVPETRKPEQVSNPKKRLNTLFQEHRGYRYNDLVHAAQIAEKIPDLARIKKSCKTFARFENKLTSR